MPPGSQPGRQILHQQFASQIPNAITGLVPLRNWTCFRFHRATVPQVLKSFRPQGRSPGPLLGFPLDQSYKPHLAVVAHARFSIPGVSSLSLLPLTAWRINSMRESSLQPFGLDIFSASNCNSLAPRVSYVSYGSSRIVTSRSQLHRYGERYPSPVLQRGRYLSSKVIDNRLLAARQPGQSSFYSSIAGLLRLPS